MQRLSKIDVKFILKNQKSLREIGLIPALAFVARSHFRRLIAPASNKDHSRIFKKMHSALRITCSNGFSVFVDGVVFRAKDDVKNEEFVII